MRLIELPPDRPALMAILNVTPDSFSESGLYFDLGRAIEAGRRMREEGGDIIDVGGESTRPGAEPVPTEEELRRILPVIAALASEGAAVSVDTRKPEVARQALRAGASIVNDVSGLRDPAMIAICSEAKAYVCIMHMLGTPETMQRSPEYENVVQEVRSYLVEQARKAEEGGVSREKIWIDPGIGFGKTVLHNVALLNHLDEFADTGYPVLIGVSRKSFLGRLVDSENPPTVEDRLEGSLAAQVVAQMKGVMIIRAHDVKAARRSIDTVAAITNERNGGRSVGR